MSDDLAHAVGEVVIAIDGLVEARIEPLGDADLAMQDLEKRLESLAVLIGSTLIATFPESAMRDVALAGADHPRGPASNPFSGSAPISREAIRGVAVQRAKQVLAREYGITPHELDRHMAKGDLIRGIRRYLERLCWDEEDIRLLLSHPDIGLIDKEV